MMSVLRPALAQTCQLRRRRLATAALATEVSQVLRPDFVRYDQLKPEHSDLPRQAVSTVEPVYLSMTSLLRPSKTASAEDQIAILDPTVFRHPIRRDILHLCIVHYLDSLRQGTASTKTRGEVRGSGRKIRPQKGSGMARLGDGQSPMLRGGGVAFGPKPRDFSTKLPRKVIQMGMRVGLSAKVRERSLGVVESLEWTGTKTSELATRIEELGWRKTLFVTGKDKVPEGLERSIRNIARFEAVRAEDLKVYDLVRWPRLVLDIAAVDYFERTLSKGIPFAPTALP